jgi:hypothetical protein
MNSLKSFIEIFLGVFYTESVLEAWLEDQQPAEAKATGKPTCSPNAREAESTSAGR